MSNAFNSDRTPTHKKIGRLALGVVAIIGGALLSGLGIWGLLPPGGPEIPLLMLFGGVGAMLWGIYALKRGGRDEPKITYKPGSGTDAKPNTIGEGNQQ
jgi:hypothetical protein